MSEQVADDDRELEGAGQRLKKRRLHVESEPQATVGERCGSLRQNDEEPTAKTMETIETSPTRAVRLGAADLGVAGGIEVVGGQGHHRRRRTWSRRPF